MAQRDSPIWYRGGHDRDATGNTSNAEQHQLRNMDCPQLIRPIATILLVVVLAAGITLGTLRTLTDTTPDW